MRSPTPGNRCQHYYLSTIPCVCSSPPSMGCYSTPSAQYPLTRSAKTLKTAADRIGTHSNREDTFILPLLTSMLPTVARYCITYLVVSVLPLPLSPLTRTHALRLSRRSYKRRNHPNGMFKSSMVQRGWVQTCVMLQRTTSPDYRHLQQQRIRVE